MSVKEDVLRILNDNKEVYLSGEEIAGRLGVSRAAVCKAVKGLNAEGYDISGLSRLGYRMHIGDDILSIDGINKYIDKEMKDVFAIEVFKTISSTNTVLKEKAVKGAEEWHIFVASEQTAGRGRMNRTFYSPSDSGIYMSILFRPKLSAQQALLITTMTATAVSEAIDELFHIETKIKWVNDIYYHGRKICGILTEAAVNVETAMLDYAVVGIGVNVKAPVGDFPEDIRSIAGAILSEQPDEAVRDNVRNRLTAGIIGKMYRYYGMLKADRMMGESVADNAGKMGHQYGFMESYKRKSMLIGKKVYILSDESREELLVLDIDDNAALVVEHADGRIEALKSGEVSVRESQWERNM